MTLATWALAAAGAARAADGPAYDASFVQVQAPGQVLVDQVFAARITMRNTGTAPWAGIPYSDHPHPQPVLYSQDPPRNKTWGTDFAYMGQGVEAAPGKEFTFASSFQAPHEPGEYAFRWRLARRERDGRLVFFGETAAAAAIKVLPRPQAPASQPPANGPGKKVLACDDFQYIGSFKIPERVGEGGAGYSETGMALRKTAGGADRLILNFTHPRQTLFEVEIPPLARFDGDDSRPLRVAAVKKVWGSLAIRIDGIAGIEHISPHGGLWWDEPQRTLYWTWCHGYWTGPAFPLLAASKLDDEGTVTSLGSWTLPPAVTKWKSYWGGVTRLPQAFADQYTGGRRLALGFGGYYSICAGCSRGPALAAVPDPGAGKAVLDVLELLCYPDPAAAPRDGHYFYGLGTIWHTPPAGPGEGRWTMDDMCRNGVFIDLPDKHGYLAFVRLAVGRIGYDYGAIGSGGACHAWYLYDPQDLGDVAKGRKKPAEIVPHSMARVSYPGMGENVVRRAQEQGHVHASGLMPPVVGSCFDEPQRLLYVLAPCSTTAGLEHHPCVNVYKVK